MRNKSKPEGSIAEGYLADECLTFCSRYLGDGVETKFNRPGRNADSGGIESFNKLSVFTGIGQAIGKPIQCHLNEDEWKQAHLYVLSNCDEVAMFVEIHKKEIMDSHGGKLSVRELDITHNAQFGEWFERHVRKMKENGEMVNEQLDKLSVRPSRSGYSYNGDF